MRLSIFQNWWSPSDEQAMWRVRMHDDAEAFAGLVARWEVPIRGLCLRMLGDEHRASDAVQEIFSAVYLKRAAYQPQAKFSTYLWRVAVNRCLDMIRQTHRRREDSIEVIEGTMEEGAALAGTVDEQCAPDHAMQRAEKAVEVREALLRLPEHYRAVVVLKHYEGLRFSEIAEVLGIAEGTVKSRMAEAMTRLARSLRCFAPNHAPRLG